MLLLPTGPMRSRSERMVSRLVVVSTFPPRRDGIARYADQLAAGHAGSRPVLRLGLSGSTADRTVRLDGALRPLRIVRETRQGDEIILMWHPEFYVSGRAWDRIAAYLALGIVLRTRSVSVVVHEPDLPIQHPSSRLRRIVSHLERTAQRWCWGAPATFVFHSDPERHNFLASFGRPLTPPRTRVVAHGTFFRPYADVSRQQARRQLGVDAGIRLFLCIGFLGRHKGFDRAIRAFAALPVGMARLFIVGSALYESPDVLAYAQELRALAAAVPGITIIERFLDDAEFDLWIRAASAVLAPYRAASSSSVIARARLLGTTVVASPVGGLLEQLSSGDIVVNNDQELAGALQRLAGEPAAG
jgi:glycosyltransferase involved in cell wall biosynthesis